MSRLQKHIAKLSARLSIVFLTFFITYGHLLCQLEVDTTGKLRNMGQIKVNKKLVTSSGKILNAGGQIYIKGSNALVNQDTLLGYVEFDKDGVQGVQVIPLITYDSISLKGNAAKVFTEKNKPLTSMGYFYSSANNIKWNKQDNIEIHTNGYTRLDGVINEGEGHGRVKMNGVTTQAVTGTGRYKELELDNPEGAKVVEGGGFYVSTKLILTRGRLQNDEKNNFTMASKSTLERTAYGTIDLGPFWESPGNIVYKASPNSQGNFVEFKDFKTGGELYHSEKGEKNSRTNSVDTLIVENPGGVQLAENVTVNHSLQLNGGGDLVTYEEVGDLVNVLNEKELTFNGDGDPVYSGNAEVRGKMTRTGIVSGRSYLFNNKYTTAKFDNEVFRNGVSSLTFDIKKQIKYAENPFFGSSKIVRTMSVDAKGADGINKAENYNLTYNFAWRNKQFGSLEQGEVPVGMVGFQPQDFMLLSWVPEENTWDNILTRNQRFGGNNGDDLNWSVGEANVIKNGLYSIGFEQSRLDMMHFAAKVALEGAFNLDPSRDILMKTDLADSNRIPSTPPAVYPYLLDPNRAFIVNTTIPKNVVDWVIIEFRDDDFTPNQRHFKTALLKNDGSLLDVDGFSPVTLSRNSTQNLDTTGKSQYYVAIRHRNHLTVMSENPLMLSQTEAPIMYDFTKSDILMGGSNSVKPMGRDKDGSLIFTMLGGNFVKPNVNRNDILAGILGIDEITEDDYLQSWQETDFEGYFDTDFELSGYVNSRDFNISWNNRLKRAVIK